MTSTAMLTSAGLIAAGLVGGAIALGPARSAKDAGALVNAAIAPHEARLVALETRVAKAEREREAAERQIAEAYSTALETKQELERLRAQTDEMVAFVGGGSGAGSASRSKPQADESADEPALASPAAAGQVPLSVAPGGEASPEQVAAVKAALDEIRKQQDEERRVAREARRQERQQRRIADLQQRLGIDATQAQQIGTIWEEAQAKRSEVLQAMRDGSGASGSPTDIRQVMTALQNEEQQKIQQVLTPDQYAEYQKMQQEQQPARGWGARTGGTGAMQGRQAMPGGGTGGRQR